MPPEDLSEHPRAEVAMLDWSSCLRAALAASSPAGSTQRFLASILKFSVAQLAELIAKALHTRIGFELDRFEIQDWVLQAPITDAEYLRLTGKSKSR